MSDSSESRSLVVPIQLIITLIGTPLVVLLACLVLMDHVACASLSPSEAIALQDICANFVDSVTSISVISANCSDAANACNNLSNWRGISCGSGPSITQINLPNLSISGTIPSTIGSFTSILQLYLQSNKLSGSIPPEIGKLAKLTNMYFNGNKLGGTLPIEIGNLTKMLYLYLQSNLFYGGIPKDIGNLSSLRHLYVHSCKLNESIPPEIGKLRNLQILYLDHNMIPGTLPRELGNLSTMSYMYLDDNAMTGPIPPEMSSLNAQYLRLQNNAGLCGTFDVPPSASNTTYNCDLSKNPKLCYNRVNAICGGIACPANLTGSPFTCASYSPAPNPVGVPSPSSNSPMFDQSSSTPVVTLMSPSPMQIIPSSTLSPSSSDGAISLTSPSGVTVSTISPSSAPPSAPSPAIVPSPTAAPSPVVSQSSPSAVLSSATSSCDVTSSSVANCADIIISSSQLSVNLSVSNSNLFIDGSLQNVSVLLVADSSVQVNGDVTTAPSSQVVLTSSTVTSAPINISGIVTLNGADLILARDLSISAGGHVVETILLFKNCSSPCHRVTVNDIYNSSCYCASTPTQRALDNSLAVEFDVGDLCTSQGLNLPLIIGVSVAVVLLIVAMVVAIIVVRRKNALLKAQRDRTSISRLKPGLGPAR